MFTISTASMKINQIPFVIFQATNQFSFKFSFKFSCVMTHNSCEIYQLKHHMLWTKRAHQSKIFQTFECSNESPPNSSCHYQNHKVRVYSNFASLFNVMKDNSSVFIWLRLLRGWVKIHQIPHVIFETTSQFFFKLCTNLQCHDNSSVLFQLKLYMIWTKGTRQSAKFQTSYCSRGISPNLYFDGLFSLKVYKISTKKVQRSYVSSH